MPNIKLIFAAMFVIFALSIINLTCGTFLWINVIGIMIHKIAISETIVRSIVIEGILLLSTEKLIAGFSTQMSNNNNDGSD